MKYESKYKKISFIWKLAAILFRLQSQIILSITIRKHPHALWNQVIGPCEMSLYFSIISKHIQNSI